MLDEVVVAHSAAVEELPASSQAPSQMSGAGRCGMDEVASQPMFFFLRNPFLIAVPSLF